MAKEAIPGSAVGMSVMLCFATSVIELGASADICSNGDNAVTPSNSCGHGRWPWAIACGACSALVCLIRLIVFRFRPNTPPKIDVFLGILLVLLWIFGAAFNTSSKGVFTATNNGYFATWLAFFASVYYLGSALSVVSDRLKNAHFDSGLALIIVASIVEMSVAADLCVQGKVSFSAKTFTCIKQHGWAVAVGAVSTLLCLIHILIARFSLNVSLKIGKVFSLLLVALWAAGAAVNTSAQGAFNSSCTSANGYFATWAAFFASLHFAQGALFPQENPVQYENMQQQQQAPTDS